MRHLERNQFHRTKPSWSFGREWQIEHRLSKQQMCQRTRFGSGSKKWQEELLNGDTYVQISSHVVVNACRRIRDGSLLGCVLEERVRETDAISEAVSIANVDQDIIRLSIKSLIDRKLALHRRILRPNCQQDCRWYRLIATCRDIGLIKPLLYVLEVFFAY